MKAFLRKLVVFHPVPAKDALTILAAATAVIIGLFEYHYTSRSEFLKPVREAQLNLYMDASSAAATLATAEIKSPEWRKARADFNRLYYGPLAMVESFTHDKNQKMTKDTITVERAMIAFKDCLDDVDCVYSEEMQNLSLALAHTCRTSLGSTWGVKAEQLEGDYQTMILQRSR